MKAELDGFETRLLHTLREHVEAAAPDVVAAPRRRRRRLLGTAAAVAAGAVGLLVMPGLGTPPAYSVQEGNAGEIIVEILEPTDAPGLERALETHGIAADITYLPELQTCAPGRYTEIERPLSGLMVSVGETSIGMTIAPGTVREGETVVLSWSVLPMTAAEIADLNLDSEPGVTAVSGFHATVETAVAAGAVQQCQPVPSSTVQP